MTSAQCQQQAPANEYQNNGKHSKVISSLLINYLSLFSPYHIFKNRDQTAPFRNKHLIMENTFEPRQVVENMVYYQLLGISQKATQQQIKKAFRKLAIIQSGREIGGDPQRFKQLCQAYQVLSDPHKRQIYDRVGSIGVESEQLFSFTDFFPRKTNSGQTRAHGTKVQLHISLKQAYNGDKITIPHKRKRFCRLCHATGHKTHIKCEYCNGKRPIDSNGAYSAISRATICKDCVGRGKIGHQQCQQCMGKTFFEEQKLISVIIPKGAYQGLPLVAQYQGDQSFEAKKIIPAGDLVLVIVEDSHFQFKRKGADLYMEKSISLAQALTGFRFDLQHLDGVSYTIATKTLDIIGDSQTKQVKGLGMPFYGSDSEYGNLIIEFKVKMPTHNQMGQNLLAMLRRYLPEKPSQELQSENCHVAHKIDKCQTSTSQQGDNSHQQSFQQEFEGHR